MDEIEVPVLIVGGSLVGLSAATLLAHHGVRSLTVERHSGTAIHPRAAHATQRTMEILRALGLEAPVCERSTQQFVQDGGVVAVETLVGGATTEFIADLNAGVRDVSPCQRVFLSQNALEPLLAERARELGATLRFATEIVSIDEHADGVTAQLRDRTTGTTSTVRSTYVLAADGAHSGVRERLGIGMRGRAPFSNSVTIYFRANLRPLLEGRRWAVVYVNNDRMRGFFRFEKPFDSAFLVVNTLGDPARPVADVSTDLTPQRARELVAIALGSSEIAVEIDAMMYWQAEARVADKLQTERVFIVGDAAHVMPPTGGFGGNTGVQDVHNLAWKIAAVLDRRAPARLLQSYETERRPVAELSVEQAYTRYVLRTDPSLGTAQCAPLVPDLNIELGYVYRSDAVLSEQPDDGLQHTSPRESRGRPGTRVPHFWLKHQGRRISSVDLFDRRFVWLGGPAAAEWRRCAQAARSAVKMELEIVQPGQDGLEDENATLSALCGIAPDGGILVRPDGFVCWRARTGQDASQQELHRVLSRLLGQKEAPL